MLTIRKIKDFCYKALGVLARSKDEIVVKRYYDTYWIKFPRKAGVTERAVDILWKIKSAGTEYEQLKIFKN